MKTLSAVLALSLWVAGPHLLRSSPSVVAEKLKSFADESVAVAESFAGDERDPDAAVAVARVKHIGTAGTSTAGTTSLTVTIPSGGVAAGNRLVAKLSTGAAAGAVGASDSRGNTWSVDANEVNGTLNVRVVVLSAHVTTALSGGNTVTVSFPVVTNAAVTVDEYSGIAATGAVDQKTGASAGTALPSSGNVTTTSDGQLLVGVVGPGGNATATFQPGPGWSSETAARGGTRHVFAEYRVAPTKGTFRADGTLNPSMNWAAVVVTYKAAAGGGGGAPSGGGFALGPGVAVQPPAEPMVDATNVADADERPAGPPPEDLVAQATSPASVLLTWSAAPDAIGYTVIRYPETKYQKLTPTPIPGTPSSTRLSPDAMPRLTYEDKAVWPSTTIKYRVLSEFGERGEYSPGPSEIASVLTPPGAHVTNLQAIAGPGYVTLTWEAPGASGVMILRSDGQTLNNGQLVRATTYTDKSPPAGTVGYRVIAHYRDQQGQDDMVALSGPTPVPAVVATAKALAPTNVKVEVDWLRIGQPEEPDGINFQIGEMGPQMVHYPGARIRLKWTGAPGATNYTAVRALASDGRYADGELAKSTSDSDQLAYGPHGVAWTGGCSTDCVGFTTIKDVDVKIGASYLFKVLAHFAEGSTGESDAVMLTIPTPPKGPANLNVTSSGSGSVTLTWAPDPQATSYLVRRSTVSEPSGVTNVVTPVSGTPYVESGLTRGQRYFYDVRAVYATGFYAQPSVEVFSNKVDLTVP